uniref:UPF3A regulator of nonsense mediated mRNA decay n=1 Tax=Loxodonta africana TaxID=9785 RepID=G5E7D9_LOXAF
QVVIRRLPPSLTKEQLDEQLHPLPAHDYFEFCTANLSLYPHLYSRAYINFRNPDDILLFRDRFDGYIFIDSKGLEYPAVVEFAPFQKISKKKLKKKDAKTGSIEDDPDYKKFLEVYSMEEEKTSANPETLLGEIEAKTRELIARRTTPLLEYIKNRKLEKQVEKEIRIKPEVSLTSRRKDVRSFIGIQKEPWRRDVKSRKEDQRLPERKYFNAQIPRILLLKKPEKGEEPATEKPKERGEEIDIGDGEWEKFPSCAVIKSKRLESSLKELKENCTLDEGLQSKSQNDSDKEQRDMERRFQEKELETQRYHLDDGRKHRANYEFDKYLKRNEDELKWGKGFTQNRGKKVVNDLCICTTSSVKTQSDLFQKQNIKDRPAMQLYQPGARTRARLGSTSNACECGGRPAEESGDGRKREAEAS